MIFKTKFIIWVVFLLLIVANIFVFLNSIRLSDKINRFEKEIASLHQENLVLENRIYKVDSLQYAASIAAQLNFWKKAEAVFLNGLKYARNH